MRRVVMNESWHWNPRECVGIAEDAGNHEINRMHAVHYVDRVRCSQGCVKISLGTRLAPSFASERVQRTIDQRRLVMEAIALPRSQIHRSA